MPSRALTETFEAALKRHAAAVAELVPLLIEMAVGTVADVLPGTRSLETRGEMNEDWLFTLRIQRVLGRYNEVLFDIESRDHDPDVAATIHEVGIEYLDLLLDLTGDDYLGLKTISLSA